MITTFYWSMAGVFALMFVLMGIESLIYDKMVSESQNMQHTQIQIFKQIKMKYDGMCRIGKNVNDTGNFVNKIMLGWKICGLRHDIIRRIEKFMVIAFVYVGVAVSMYLYFTRGFCKECVIIPAGTTMMGLALKMWEITLDADYKKRKMLIMITDYLENQMNNGKIHKASDVSAMQTAAALEMPEKIKERESERNIETDVTNEYDETLINEVLNEFLE